MGLSSTSNTKSLPLKDNSKSKTEAVLSGSKINLLYLHIIVEIEDGTFQDFTKTQFIELTGGKSQDVPRKDEFYISGSRLCLNTFHPISMHICTSLRMTSIE